MGGEQLCARDNDSTGGTMKMIVRLMACGLLALLTTGYSAAQGYPNKPIRILIGFAPGNTYEICLRPIGVEISKRIGQPFIIENRPGNSGLIAVGAVKRADPDGYTLYGGSFESVVPG